MALKAGRRGLHKRLVDAFGNLNGEAPSGDYYTKQQTDNKFETKTHVNNTFQKKTLEVPIEMLSGTKLTVEDALQGLAGCTIKYKEIAKANSGESWESQFSALWTVFNALTERDKKACILSYGDAVAYLSSSMTDISGTFTRFIVFDNDAYIHNIDLKNAKYLRMHLQGTSPYISIDNLSSNINANNVVLYKMIWD